MGWGVGRGKNLSRGKIIQSNLAKRAWSFVGISFLWCWVCFPLLMASEQASLRLSMFLMIVVPQFLVVYPYNKWPSRDTLAEDEETGQEETTITYS